MKHMKHMKTTEGNSRLARTGEGRFYPPRICEGGRQQAPWHAARYEDHPGLPQLDHRLVHIVVAPLLFHPSPLFRFKDA